MNARDREKNNSYSPPSKHQEKIKGNKKQDPNSKSMKKTSSIN